MQYIYLKKSLAPGVFFVDTIRMTINRIFYEAFSFLVRTAIISSKDKMQLLL